MGILFSGDQNEGRYAKVYIAWLLFRFALSLNEHYLARQDQTLPQVYFLYKIFFLTKVISSFVFLDLIKIIALT